jgi:hypothetical protein
MNPIILRADPRIPGVWCNSVEYLEAALEHGGNKDWDIMHVYNLACAGQVQLWVLVDDNKIFGACVTSEASYPKRRMLEILLLGTEPNSTDRWHVCLEQFIAMARANGFNTMTGTGRPGWSKMLGATTTRVVWEMELGEAK